MLFFRLLPFVWQNIPSYLVYDLLRDCTLITDCPFERLTSLWMKMISSGFSVVHVLLSSPFLVQDGVVPDLPFLSLFHSLTCRVAMLMR